MDLSSPVYWEEPLDVSTHIDVDQATRELLSTTTTEAFDPAELDGLPEPVRRYLAASIAPGATVATVAAIRMRGQIKVSRWLPFRAEEVLAPHRGFVWRARAAGLISGHDAYLDARGAMQWKLLGLVTVMRAEDDDVARSGAGRCGGEALWLPTALLPRFGVAWSAPSNDEIAARFDLDGTRVGVQFQIARQGLPVAVVLDRWGDPDRTGTFGWHPFGGTITAHHTFNGITVPSRGRWGWHYGTDRWEDGEFFRCQITDHQPSSISATAER